MTKSASANLDETFSAHDHELMALVDYSCDTFANREEIMSGERLCTEPFVY